MYHLDSNKKYEEKAWWKLHKNAMCYFEEVLEAALHKKGSCMATYFPSHKPSK